MRPLALLSRRHRRPFRVYGVDIKRFELERDGDLQYAQWLHPYERPKTVTQTDVDAVRRFVAEGDTVIDVGAHTGDTTMPMAVAAGASGCTIALEPNPHVFRVLEQNAELNPDKTNIVPLNLAATERDGTFTFHYSDTCFCNGGFFTQIRARGHGHRHPLAVEGRNLEQLLRQDFADRLGRLSYIKIDTEGYDKNVLRSIAPTLHECRPVIVTEVFKRLTTPERDELFQILQMNGYVPFRYQPGPEPCGPRVEAADMRRWEQFDILAIPKERA
jgi:FkbM family methyltransferase